MKKKKKKKIVFKLIFACFTIYALFSIVTVQIELNKRQGELKELKQTVEDSQQEVDHLQKQLDSELTEENLTRIARERLGYAYLDERVYVNVSGD